MISKFFINRPIFATVIAIVMVLVGLVTIYTLPVAQFPDITPPTVQVTAVYPCLLYTSPSPRDCS